MQLFNKIQDEKYGLQYDLMAANFIANSAATMLGNRTNKKEESRRRKQSNLDSFIETPFDRYNYESYSDTPYMKDGGMVHSMRSTKKGIFNMDLYKESRPIQVKHKPNVGLNDVMGRMPSQFKKGGVYAEGGEFWDNIGEEEVNDSTSSNTTRKPREITKSRQTPQKPNRPVDYKAIKPIRGKRNSNGSAIKQGLLDRGFSNDEAAAITGNIYAESTFNPQAVNSSSKAYGLMQWLGDRKNKLHSEYGDNPSLDNQLDYIAWELQGGNKYESGQFKKAMRGKTLEDKTLGFAKYVERPSPKEIKESMNRRNNYARLYK